MEPGRRVTCPRYRFVILTHQYHLLTSLSIGDEKLILMTSALDVLSEAPLHTADYGEGDTIGECPLRILLNKEIQMRL